LADIGYGVLGVMAPSFNHDFWAGDHHRGIDLLLSAAAGHVRQLITAHNLTRQRWSHPLHRRDHLPPRNRALHHLYVTIKRPVNTKANQATQA
jgi:hypothetical protein